MKILGSEFWGGKNVGLWWISDYCVDRHGMVDMFYLCKTQSSCWKEDPSCRKVALFQQPAIESMMLNFYLNIVTVLDMLYFL